METGQEGVVGCKCQDPLLCHRALNVVILDDHVLLQHLYIDDHVRGVQSRPSFLP